MSNSGDARSSITILVLGDEGVGKSSLISTFVSRHFSEMVPGLMTQVRLPPEPDSSCITTIRDSQRGDELLQNKSESSLTSLLHKTVQDRVDSIVLVYDLDRVETFYRLETHWLPLIERYYHGEVPVIVAGTKWDLVRATLDEQSNIRSRQQLVSLLQRFRFVRQCIKCSAKNLLKVQDVFVKAQQAVLYPFSPLFDLSTGTLTTDCQKALTRIFRMFDSDNDGLLSNAELDAFQYHTFKLPLVDRDLQGWKKIVSRNNSLQQQHQVIMLQDGKFTVAGFLAIFDVFISQNRLDVPWKVFRKFGYTNNLELTIPPQKFNINSVSKLTKADCKFLAALFQQFDTNGKGTLSARNLADIFSLVPGPALPPWHPMRADTLLKGCFSVPVFGRDISRELASRGGGGSMSEELSVSASGITIASAATLPTVGGATDVVDWNTTISNTLAPMSFYQWMGHWHMLSTISPDAAQAELFRLGHVSGTVTAPGGTHLRSKRKKLAPTVPSEVLVLYVLGSQGCGKSSLLHLLGDSLMDPKETEPTLRPETSTAHLIMGRRRKDNKEEKEEIVVHFIFTEVPRQTDRTQLAPLLKQSRPCLVVFCFDSEKSLSDAMELEAELLDDDVARVFVFTTKGDGDEDTVVKNASVHCHDLDLEPPLAVNTFHPDVMTMEKTIKADRNVILSHLARCGLDEMSGLDGLKSKPHAEEKRRLAMRRRKMIWLGGLVTVSVAVAVSVGVLWSSSKTQKTSTSRFGWLTELLFGRSNRSSTQEATTKATMGET